MKGVPFFYASSSALLWSNCRYINFDQLLSSYICLLKAAWVFLSADFIYTWNISSIIFRHWPVWASIRSQYPTLIRFPVNIKRKGQAGRQAYRRAYQSRFWLTDIFKYSGRTMQSTPFATGFNPLIYGNDVGKNKPISCLPWLLIKLQKSLNDTDQNLQ